MIGKEPSFGRDVFHGAKYHNETETVANAILNLLFGKPGYFPSMPELGINIQQYLYQFWDEVDPNLIKARIVSQCTFFQEFVDDGTLNVIKSSYQKKPMLLVVLPVVIKNNTEHLAIAITQGSDGNIHYNYEYIVE